MHDQRHTATVCLGLTVEGMGVGKRLEQLLDRVRDSVET